MNVYNSILELNRFGADSVMLWTVHPHSRLSINEDIVAQRDINEIRKNISFTEEKNRCAFQQGNARPHSARAMGNSLGWGGVAESPSHGLVNDYSPDPRPIEYPWDELGR